MNRLVLRLALGLILLSFAACASMNSSHAPDANVKNFKSFYVVHAADDDRRIDELIAARLATLGYTSSSGDSATPPQPADATVTYVDKWMWDMTMYMTRLTIEIRDGKTGAIVAYAESNRPSLQRKTPEGMIEEVLGEVFK